MGKPKAVTPQVQVFSKVEFDSPRKRIGILGGTFNPPHLGHLIIADQVQNQLGLDKIMFMPDNIPPHIDHKETILPYHRLNMLRLCVKDHPKFEIEDYEIQRGGISYSIDTIKALVKKHPENQYYFIIGGDMVAYLPKWRKIDELVQLVQFVGVGRPGYQKQSPYPLLWVDIPEIGISSTLIREKVKGGFSIHYLVPSRVEQYIKEERLYLE